MKKTSVVLVLVLAACAAAVPVAQAVTPKTGLWKSVNKTQPSQKEKGKIEVFKSKGKFSLRFETPEFSVKCTSPNAPPKDVGDQKNAFIDKVAIKGEKRRFSKTVKQKRGGSSQVQTYSGKFTAAGKASGTYRYQSVSGSERCDSGVIKWTATR